MTHSHMSFLGRSLCSGLVLAACGGRAVEGSGTDGEESSSGDDSDTNPSSTVTIDPVTTDPATTDPVTTDPVTTDPATTDPDTSGNPETTGNPATESCCEVHDTPSCDDEDVAACVCKASADCCVFEWADNCVEIALNDCDATCEDPTESSGGQEESSTGEPATDCEETMQIELSAEDATLDGFELVESSFPEEGTVAAVIVDGMNTPEGTVTWDIDIPCNDDWHIWVRGRNAGQDDSFFARQDGGPDPAPIFELDCGGGNDYLWNELNWRDPEMGAPCEYVEDPWLAQWETGPHQFQLEYRESPAVARIIVTNDDAFVPE